MSSRAVLRFLGLFILVYGVLIAPWPGWNDLYSSAFRHFGEAALGSSGARAIHFQRGPAGQPLDTQILVFRLTDADARGRIKAHMLRLDSRGVGWIPTAFLTALIFASPVSWPRRGRSLLWGWVALYLYLILAMRIYIWHRTMTGAAGFGATLAAGLEDTLVTQLGPSFVIPALLWLIITFRQSDFRAFLNRWTGPRDTIGECDGRS